MLICMRRGKRLRVWRVVRIMGCREGLCHFSGLWVLVYKNLLLGGLRQKLLQGGIQTKTEINPVSVFRVFDLLFIHIKPYESELSTALYECKAVARCATRKTNTAINRIKTVVTHKQSTENTSRRKQNKNRWSLQTVDTFGKQIHR